MKSFIDYNFMLLQFIFKYQINLFSEFLNSLFFFQ